MKKINIKNLLVLGILSLAFVGCEDDDPLTAGQGNPLLKEVVNVEATVTPEFDAIGEGTSIEFTVDIPSSFQSDAAVTVTLDLDNGNRSTGTATILAGQTSGSGSVTVPADDGVESTTDYLGLQDAAQLYASGILLEELVPGTSYTISSNVVSLGVFDIIPEANPAGLEILLDWANPDVNDLDLYLLDFPATGILDDAETGDRYEELSLENSDYDDGAYQIGIASFTTPPAGGTPMTLMFVRPDGDLEAFSLVFPEGGGLEFFVSFEKVTDEETGIISYTNFTAL